MVPIPEELFSPLSLNGEFLSLILHLFLQLYPIVKCVDPDPQHWLWQNDYYCTSGRGINFCLLYTVPIFQFHAKIRN